jgi:hypothetical protein
MIKKSSAAMMSRRLIVLGHSFLPHTPQLHPLPSHRRTHRPGQRIPESTTSAPRPAVASQYPQAYRDRRRDYRQPNVLSPAIVTRDPLEKQYTHKNDQPDAAITLYHLTSPTKLSTRPTAYRAPSHRPRSASADRTNCTSDNPSSTSGYEVASARTTPRLATTVLPSRSLGATPTIAFAFFPFIPHVSVNEKERVRPSAERLGVSYAYAKRLSQ